MGESMSKKCILLNSIMVGSYGFNQGNLPHEIINFFKADDENYYVYITPHGNVSVDPKSIKYVFFIRSVDKRPGFAEVVAMAEVGDNPEFYCARESVSEGKIKEDDKKREQEKWEKIIKYDGVSIFNIHKLNKEDNDIRVSMKVKAIRLPKETIFLRYKTKKVSHVDKGHVFDNKIINQSMKKIYYEENDGNGDYKYLKELAKEEDLWEDVKKYDEKINHNSNNFFTITRQQDNELMFSNMFYYMFTKYPKLLEKFVEKVLKINEKMDKILVSREKNHVDITIEYTADDKKKIILIENKIKSGINGKIQLYNGNDKKKKGKYTSQLSVYYKEARKKYDESAVSCFIFKPNYNEIDTEKYVHGDKYKVINYGEIHKFLVDNCCDYGGDIYIEEFVKAIEKHTHEVDKSFRDELMIKFKERIEKARQIKSCK